MEDRDGFHMSAEEFRACGKAVVEWIADYWDRVEDFPVMSRVAPGDVRAGLPPHPPQQGESFATMLADVDRVVMPGITHWQSPNFFAYFPANVSAPSVLGELLCAGLGVQGMLWATSPACTELETHVLDWVVEMLGLPPHFRSDSSGGGVIQDTASNAALCALIAARERAMGGGSNRTGADPRLTVYTSTQAHSSIEKAVRVAGIGSDRLRKIDVDAGYGMRVDLLRKAIAEDRANGFVPTYVCATLGTTSSTAFDPLPAIGALCRDEGIWLHVDAALAGSAAVCPEFRPLQAGVDLADSYCFNPHKWLFTNTDCDCFFVKDRAALIGSLSILPEYLRNRASDSGAVIDYREWQIQLGRRFRALKLWFVIRHYGIDGLRHHVRAHVAMARDFEQWVRLSDEFELAAPAPLNLVCFRHRAGDDANRRLLDALNADGHIFLSHTVLDGRHTLRMSIGQTHTAPHHVRAAWELIRATAAHVC